MTTNNKRDKLKRAADVFFSSQERNEPARDAVSSVNGAKSVSDVNGVSIVEDVRVGKGVISAVSVTDLSSNTDNPNAKKMNSERVSLYTTPELKQYIEVMVWYDRTNNVSGYINELMSKDRDARTSEYEVALDVYRKFNTK
jgi:hypothetical protein